MRWAFLCSHPHTFRERLPDGRVVLICHTCGHRAPLITRTEQEQATMRARFPELPALTARKGPP
jgi:hypothetical protein